MITTNIRIITSGGRQIDYKTPADLNIKMQRIADDLQDISARFGEYSLTFSLPKTRNNVEIFEFAGVANVKNSFKVNPIPVSIFNNDMLIMVGQLEIRSIKEESYECVFYSKFTQLIDDLKDKNMTDISTCPKIPWSYEDTIRNHINSGSTAYREYEFPVVFYNTLFCPTSVFSGLTDTIVDYNGTTNHLFQRQRDYQNWYYMINRTGATPDKENEVYMHQIPLAFRLKAMMEYMLSDIGWTMGGSFFEDSDIKRIVVPYVGDTDVYDRASYCSNGADIIGSSCGAGTLMLDTAKFMPDYSCVNFLKDVMLMFNLYFMIDVLNKTIIFETYDTMFGSKVSPYDITSKLIGDSIAISKVEDYNPSLSFDDVDNDRVLGDNRYIASSGTSAYNAKYCITSGKNIIEDMYNHIGSTSGEIKLGFGKPTVKRMRIRNEYNYSDVNKSAGDSVIFLPYISKQLPEDNKGKNFSKADGDSVVFNNEETIQYNGKPTLYFYYGISASDFNQKTVGIGAQKDYFYFNFDDVNQKIPFCSPFALTAYRDNVKAVLEASGANPTGSSSSANAMLASYMQSIYLMMAGSTGVTNPTSFSLIFADNNEFSDTIYTKYHSNKYRRYQQSELLTADMIMTDNDWREMQINQPMKYNNQIYSIVEISNYDIVKQQAQIILIKQL